MADLPGSGKDRSFRDARRRAADRHLGHRRPGSAALRTISVVVELGGGWGISGMFTNFLVPADPTNKLSTETTFVREREFAERAFLFIEYVGYYHVHGGPSYLFNSGGGYRITPTQQIDFHIGIGLNDNAPAYIFGVGYSFRLDGPF